MSLRAMVLALAVVGCGRYGFGDITAGGDGGAGDDGGGATDAMIGACDTGAVRITMTAGDSYAPTLVWSGTEYGMAWHEIDGLYFVRLDTSAHQLMTPVNVGPSSSSLDPPALLYDGGTWLLAWNHDPGLGTAEDLYVARVSATGTVMTGPTRVTTTTSPSRNPMLAPIASGYGLGWIDRPNGQAQDLYFGMLDASATTLSGGQALTTATGSNYVGARDVLGTGSAFVVGYTLGGDSFFQAINSSGAASGAAITLTANGATANGASIAPAGSASLIAWTEQGATGRGAYVRPVGASGTPLAAAMNVLPGSSPAYPILRTAGSRIGLTMDDGASSIRFIELDALGVPLGAAIKVADTINLIFGFAADDVGYAVAFVLGRDGNAEIYFRRFCP